MPELPEVETVRRGLNKLTLQQTIKSVEVLLPRTISYPPESEAFTSGLQDKAIASWHRRGKYLLAELDKDTGWLGVHLRMTGQLLWTEQTEALQKHTRVRLLFAQGKELRFVDTRTFGKMWLVPANTEPAQVITGLKKLGLEPFDSKFTAEHLATKLATRSRNIKTLLLDQGVVAGIGNIYADEALFTSGIHPETLGKNLTPEQIKELHQASVKVLQTSIDRGGTSFSDFLNLLGVQGNYGNHALVYGRKDLPCRVCGTPISKIKLGGRSTHFCSQCQPK